MKILVLLTLLFGSCSNLRVLEEKVPAPIEKKRDHLDEEKKGAYYLAENTKDENLLVANALSRSLGNPSTIEDKPQEIAEKLFAFSSNHENQIFSLNNKLRELNGKEIQGTGFSLMPYFSGFGLVAIIALFILFPSLATILFFILKRTRSALSNVVSGVAEFTKSEPEKAKDLNDLLEKKLDRVEKNLKYKFEAK